MTNPGGAVVRRRGAALKSFIRGFALLVGICLFLTVLVQLLARGTWTLSGAGETSLADLAKIPPPVRMWTPEQIKQAIEENRVHSVAEWGVEKGRDFHEAPILAERVRRGQLPPVDRRLPEDPLVIVPPDQMGPYGGTWNRYTKSPIRTMGLRCAYEYLIRFDPMGNKLLPNLAKSWEMSDGGRTWTLHLRKGVRWSDGEPWSADDIMFWYEDILCDDKATPTLPWESTIGGERMRIEKIDDATVRFHFAGPNGMFLVHLAEAWALRLMHQTPKHYIKKFHPRYAPKEHLERLARRRGVSGPYELMEIMMSPSENEFLPTLNAWAMEGELIMTRPSVFHRNPYYWKVDPAGNQLPYIDRVMFNKAADLETINLKAINGQIGMQGRYIKINNYPLLMETSRHSRLPGSKATPFHIRHWVGPNTVILTPNLNHKDPAKNRLLNDRRVRIALSVAIDREEIRQVQFYGLGALRQNCPTETSPFYSRKLEQAYIEYDPNRANALLDEVGLDRRDGDGFRLYGDGRRLVLNIDSCDQTGYEDALQLVAQYWREVGIKSELKIRARSLWYSRSVAGMQDIHAWWYDCRQMPMDKPACPLSTSSPLARQWGKWFATNGREGIEPSPEMQEVMGLWRRMVAEPDPTAQVRIYDRIHDLMAENLWYIGLVGRLPVLIVVQASFRNVPEVAYYDWYSRGPGNTAPECYAIQN